MDMTRKPFDFYFKLSDLGLDEKELRQLGIHTGEDRRSRHADTQPHLHCESENQTERVFAKESQPSRSNRKKPDNDGCASPPLTLTTQPSDQQECDTQPQHVALPQTAIDASPTLNMNSETPPRPSQVSV